MEGGPRLDAAVRSPKGKKARARANLDAIDLSRVLKDEGRVATTAETEVLLTWSGWGGIPEIFDETKPDWEGERTRLRSLLTDNEWEQAANGVLNAHYTHPAYVEAIWRAVSDLGITSGHVLEPGCGAGTFIGLAPKEITMSGIEVDPTTASITQAIYPRAEIHAESFAETPLRRMFDGAVGNVPFGDIRLFDKVGNPGNHSIHNHFIIKSLDQVKPGGLVAVLTSSFTLDSQNPAARRDMYERADLVGAIRLPSGAHSRVAATEAVTDLVIFRKRKDGEAPQPFTWEHSRGATVPGSDNPVLVNEYFTDHPSHVLGQMRVGHGMYNSESLMVDGATDDELAGLIARQLDRIVQDAKEAGLVAAPEDIDVSVVPRVQETVAHQYGHIRHSESGGFERLTETGYEAITVPKNQTGELKALLELRDNARRLIETESRSAADTPYLTNLRNNLQRAYEAYVDKHGPINRATRTSRISIDKGTGEEKESFTRRIPSVMRVFNKDPFAPVVHALETYDEDTGIAQGAPLLTSRQVFAKYTPKGADNADDALAVALQNSGKVDLATIAYLLDVDEDQARTMLADRVFDTPDGDLVSRAEYLSGNVREKLAQARAAAKENPAFLGNVDALESVMPREITIPDLKPTLGAPWIPAEDVQAFARSLVKSKHLLISKSPQGWVVNAGKGSRSSLEETVTWGTESKSASTLIEHMLNHKDIVVTKEIKEGGTTRRVFQPQETAAAQGKAEQIAARFEQWIWEEPDRTKRILADYNRRFNSHVPRTYDAQGLGLRIPGLALSFDLRDHQKAAIARMIAEPTTGLFHDVGAGKTLEMVCGVMEQKRLGLIHKPMVVVPNHMLAQFEREWLQAFPGAKILAADSTDISNKSGRGNFAARVTSSDWDAVITTQSAFTKLSVKPETLEAYYQREHDAMRTWIDQVAASESGLSVRSYRNKLAKAEEKLKARVAKLKDGDSGLTFEDLGVDYLVVDEAHAYKNLAQPTALTSIIASQSSGRSADLDMKLGYLRDTYGERVATFATATPVANTMGEMWVMTHYLRPDLLAEAGLESFDDWAHQYVEITTNVEIKPTGEPKVTKRPSNFKNVPELIATWSTFGDTKTRAELALPVPELALNSDGKREPEIVTIDLGATMDQFNARLIERAENLSARAEKGADNWLTITSDGREMATDYRLLKEHRAERALTGVDLPAIQKVDAVADTIMRIWEQTKDNEYLDDLGSPSPTRGALQLVFCDQGTPKGNGEWDWYNELKDQLTTRGMPEEKIAFTHDAKTTIEKDQLFAKARTGAIAVLIGSTEKMGTGANMQARAIALHHVSAPWRPADLTQRDGRIIRQGNQNSEISIYRYVTRASMDTYLWQTLERKARFIGQVLSGRHGGREVEDIGTEEASYAQVKAIASGMPQLIEEARLKNEVSKYQSRSNAFASQQRFLENSKRNATASIRRYTDRQTYIAPIIEKIRPTRGDAFAMSINGNRYTDRKDAAEALTRFLAPHTQSITSWQPQRDAYRPDLTEKLAIGGLTFDIWVARTLPGQVGIDLLIRSSAYDNYRPETADSGLRISLKDLLNPQIGTILKIENHVERLAQEPERNRDRLTRLQGEITDLNTKLQETDPWATKLTGAKQQLHAIQAEIKALETGQATVDGLSQAPAANITPREPQRAVLTSTRTGIQIDPGLSTDENSRTVPIGEATGISLGETQRSERGHAFFPQQSQRESIPRLGENRHRATEDTLVHLHYFTSSTHWYITEANWDNGQAYGVVSTNGHATWETINLVSLEAQHCRPDGSSRFLPPVVVFRDTHWKPTSWKNAQRLEAPAPGSIVPAPTATTAIHAAQLPANHLSPTTSMEKGRKKIR